MQKGSCNDDVKKEGYVPVDDGEDIFFVNTVFKDGSDKSELLQLFLRRDAFENVKFPELSKAVKYFKESEGGLVEMCKTVEDYARNYAEDYLSLDYSEAELEAAEKDFKKN